MDRTTHTYPSDAPRATDRSTPAQLNLQRHGALLERLYGAAVQLLAQLGHAELLTTVVEHACALSGACCSTLYKLERDGQFTAVAHVPASASPHGCSSLDEARLARHVLAEHVPLVVDCANDTQMREAFCHGGDCPTTVSIPLEHQGRPVGVLHLVDRGTDRLTKADNLWALAQFADLAAIAVVQNERLCRAESPGTADEAVIVDQSHVTLALQTSEQPLRHMPEVFAATVTAAERERVRIARDLHDSVCQEIAGVQLQLEAARTALHRDSAVVAEQQLRAGQEILAGVDAEMRRIIQHLHPHMPVGVGLKSAIRDYAAYWQQNTGIDIQLYLDEADHRLPDHVTLSLYRIVQEALANIVRHAQARSAHIRLTSQSGMLRLVIADDGRGGATMHPGGVGLESMHARARALGASLQIISPPGGGTCIIVEVLLPRQDRGL